LEKETYRKKNKHKKFLYVYQALTETYSGNLGQIQLFMVFEMPYSVKVNCFKVDIVVFLEALVIYSNIEPSIHCFLSI